jgi:hypothetical protein
MVMRGHCASCRPISGIGTEQLFHRTSLEHESAPMVEVSMTIRDGDKVVCAFTTGVTPAARVPITLRFAPIMGRCSVDLDVRTLTRKGPTTLPG